MTTTTYAPAGWAASHHCHPAVATAIHQIATRNRSPEAIWKDPTEVEWEQATQAVERLIEAGLYRRDEDESYAWDAGTWVRLEPQGD